jgi:hypothetical protein
MLVQRLPRAGPGLSRLLGLLGALSFVLALRALRQPHAAAGWLGAAVALKPEPVPAAALAALEPVPCPAGAAARGDPFFL